LLLGDKNHLPHSPPVMSDLIHVTVADSAAPSAAAQPQGGGRQASPAGAKVYFLSPEDGAKVPLTLLVRFGLDNMAVVRAGVETPNSGHHHLIIDAPLPPLDEPIPSDENHLHFGAGQTEATITLTPGKHTLQLLVGDAHHVPHMPPIFSTPITVVAGEALERKMCNPNEKLTPDGACAPAVAAKAPNKPAPRREVVRQRRVVATHRDRNRWRTSAPGRAPYYSEGPASAPDSGQGFNDLRPCPAGSHSQSAPTSSGYRCMPNM
jgi:hypothetical protein